MKQTGYSFLHLSCPKFWLPCGLSLTLCLCLPASDGRDIPCSFPHPHSISFALSCLVTYTGFLKGMTLKLVIICVFLSSAQQSVNAHTQALFGSTFAL